jgi:hypothetical protein
VRNRATVSRRSGSACRRDRGAVQPKVKQ